MKPKIPIMAELVLTTCVALPSWVRAACPGPQTYFFSGHGDTILQSSTSSMPCDADLAF